MSPAPNTAHDRRIAGSTYGHRRLRDTLPLRREVTRVPGPSGQTKSAGDGSLYPMKHVLLLEDDADVSSVLVRLLEEEKYYVSTTPRSDNAREVLEWVKVDPFIADILLPNGTAFAALDIAKQRKGPCFPITGSFAHMAELEANGEFHLSKPFKLADFMGAVRDRIGPGDDVGRN